MGALSLHAQLSSGNRVSELTGERLSKNAEDALLAGTKQDGQIVSAFIAGAQNDTLALAASGTAHSYVQARTGSSELWNRITRAHCDLILHGILDAAVLQKASAEQTAGVDTTLPKTVLSKKVGQTGYAFVLNSQGDLLVHPRAEFIGKNVITDLKLTVFQEMLDRRRPGEHGWLAYAFESREKFLAYTYFADWDWIVCISGYMDEMSQAAAEESIQLLRRDLLEVTQRVKLQTAKGMKPCYPQVRFLDAGGKEIVVVSNGVLLNENALGTRSGADWFETARKMPEGQVYITPVEIAKNTGNPEIRIAAPVYVQGELHGVVVINVDWSLVQDLLAGSVYGKTGYAYVLNEKGVLITHPKYTLKDGTNLSDSSFGELATIVKDQMLKGATGVSRYVFEGVDKYAAFSPLILGDNHYVVAATAPVNEVTAIVREIDLIVAGGTRAQVWIAGMAVVVVSGVGMAIGVLFARSVSRALGRIIVQLTEGAGQVASASSQVSSASQSLAEGATEQAAGLQETSSSLEEMSSMTKQNAGNAQQANVLAAEAKKAAAVGASSMSQMNAAIQEIQKSADETAKIIKVIDEIAFQTNLLALNAAVEAARAGEAGKGFAVVAEEVRNLAMRSAEAAKDTAGRIEESVKNSKNGVDIAGEVGKVLEAIVQSVGKTTDLVSEIAAASQEQAQGIDQVNTTVSQMDKVTQQNAANAEESASASEELSAQAESMKEIVGQLVAMVEGAGSQTTRSGAAKADHHSIRANVESQFHAASKPKSKPRGFAKSDEILHAIARPSGKSRSSSSKTTGETMIPLTGDQGNMKEFNS
jgi:signal transduction histidine kinase